MLDLGPAPLPRLIYRLHAVRPVCHDCRSRVRRMVEGLEVPIGVIPLQTGTPPWNRTCCLCERVPAAVLIGVVTEYIPMGVRGRTLDSISPLQRI